MPNLLKPFGPQEIHILHYPRLDTVLMVEKFIQKYDGKYKKKELWGHLPKKVMYQTYCVIIEYLFDSNKISIDKERKIGWIYYPKKVKILLKEKRLFYRK